MSHRLLITDLRKKTSFNVPIRPTSATFIALWSDVVLLHHVKFMSQIVEATPIVVILCVHRTPAF